MNEKRNALNRGMRWKFRCLVLVFVLVYLFLFCDLQSLAEEKDGLKLYSQSAVLMDGYSGRVLYGKNEKQVRPMGGVHHQFAAPLVYRCRDGGNIRQHTGISW